MSVTRPLMIGSRLVVKSSWLPQVRTVGHFISLSFSKQNDGKVFATFSPAAWRFLSNIISQGSVATRLRCVGIFNYAFTRNLLLSPSVKEF